MVIEAVETKAEQTTIKLQEVTDPKNGGDQEKTKKKNADPDKSGEASPSYSGDENGEFPPNENGLKCHEMKALTEFKSRLEEAILTRTLLKKKESQEADQENRKPDADTREYAGEKQSSPDKGKNKMREETNQMMEIDENGKLWGVPLLPSRGDAATDTILVKFLKARDFNVNDAFDMLRNTLKWRIQNNMDSILKESLGSEYDDMTYMSGVDREGHPICFIWYGAFSDSELYNRTFETTESIEKFLMWRARLLEKAIQNLDFRPGGISSLLQINDLKGMPMPGPGRKDIRLATRNAVSLLENNYPELITRNVFINVPFWYYAFSAILSPFLTQRTKSQLEFARPARVTETLLKYIAAEHIPVKYGGLKRENDPDFSSKDEVSEIPLKAGGTETIEIQAPKVGSTLVWDLTVTGWEVNYKEEFIPTDESSYALIVKRQRWIGWQEESARNTFKNKEPGKVLITVENGIFKKKRILYRCKIRENSSSNV